ncbi:N-acetylglucosamine-6-phosphate deacetylase [Parvularcula maris]|uniref:N-acetylglucosamine-6-phosphate deacetylase n=1 Tax=Parvularcula maris TaxID=2965077 RepID=A0A9X2RKV1_9PROT|nr:N-acetylglucosamine-6-phosphate deacetylase [Parvularcula maris]MCQ8185987.1 N-acetylglucosamine-6-phosphate deacetylase [Parvularcula maris]
MASALTALTGARLVLPDRVADDLALLLRGGLIEGLVFSADLPANGETYDLSGMTVTPGFVDLQVNGGGGVLLNDDPSVATMMRIAEAHRRFGTTSLLPTLISDTPAKSAAATAAIRSALEENVPGVIGLHLEGPHLAPAKRGIHNDKHFRTLDAEEARSLAPPPGGSLLLTLAPERHEPSVLRQLAAQGAVLSAGHTAADYDQTRGALGAGVSGFTHLFNAMPPLLSREPGPVTAALESEAWCMVIADGHHIHDAVLKLAFRAKADGRMILVSDAMSLAGTDLRSFQFDGKTIREENGRLTDDAGTLAGSNLTMLTAVRHAVSRLGLPLHQAVRCAALEPARFLGREGEFGQLAAGCAADLNIFTDSLNLVATIKGGDLTPLLPHLR